MAKFDKIAVLNKIGSTGMVPVFYHKDAEIAKKVVKACYDGGVRAFEFTMVKNPGKENMEIITKEGEKINRYTPSEDQDKKEGKRGKKIGIAYELDNGEIIYVPE